MPMEVATDEIVKCLQEGTSLTIDPKVEVLDLERV